MKLNDEFNSHNGELNAQTVTDKAMSYLWEHFINPNIDQDDVEQVAMIAVIGMSLQAVAEKARAYEKLQDGNLDENTFYRN
jgi:hypothetical protein